MLYGVTIQIEEMSVIGNFITLCRKIQRMRLENGMRLIKEARDNVGEEDQTV